MTFVVALVVLCLFSTVTCKPGESSPATKSLQTFYRSGPFSGVLKEGEEINLWYSYPEAGSTNITVHLYVWTDASNEIVDALLSLNYIDKLNGCSSTSGGGK